MSALLLLAWFGWSLGTLLSAGAALGALVVGLYFLRVKRRSVQVPFLGLWRPETTTQKATAFRSSRVRWLSLLLQLLLLLGLLLALGDPREEGEAAEARSLVVLLDVSASMASRSGAPSGEQSRFERLEARARELVEGLGPQDRLLWIEMGARPRPLSGWSGERGELTRALESLEVLDVSADLPSALELGLDTLRGKENPEILVLSDGAFEAEALKSRSWSWGEVRLSFESMADPAEISAAPRPNEAEGDEVAPSLDNVALASFAARRYPWDAGGFEVLTSVFNAGTEEVEVELVISTEEEKDAAARHVIEISRFVVPGGESVTRSLVDLTSVSRSLVAELRRLDGRRDAIERDNVAYALLPLARQGRVLLVGAPNTFLDAALLIDPGLTVTRLAPEDYPPTERYDVTIFDGVFPERSAHTGAALYLGAPEPDPARSPLKYPVPVGAEIRSFGFDHWQKEDLLFRFFDPYDVQVLRGRALLPEGEDRVLGRSDEGVLLVQGKREPGAFLALGFDPRESDFVLRVAFPLFLSNALDVLLPERPEAAISSWATGQVWRFVTPGVDSGQVTVRGPGKRAPREWTVPIQNGRGVWFGERAGFYEVRGTERPTWLAASLFSAEESRLAPRAELVVAGKTAGRLEGFSPRSERRPWIWFLAIVLGLSVIEWFTYHRRWTV